MQIIKNHTRSLTQAHHTPNTTSTPIVVYEKPRQVGHETRGVGVLGGPDSLLEHVHRSPGHVLYPPIHGGNRRLRRLKKRRQTIKQSNTRARGAGEEEETFVFQSTPPGITQERLVGGEFGGTKREK